MKQSFFNLIPALIEWLRKKNRSRTLAEWRKATRRTHYAGGAVRAGCGGSLAWAAGQRQLGGWAARRGLDGCSAVWPRWLGGGLAWMTKAASAAVRGEGGGSGCVPLGTTTTRPAATWWPLDPWYTSSTRGGSSGAWSMPPQSQGGVQRHDIRAPAARGQPVEQLPRGVVRPRAATWRPSQFWLPQAMHRTWCCSCAKHWIHARWLDHSWLPDWMIWLFWRR
jgi:hypothetical protein